MSKAFFVAMLLVGLTLSYTEARTLTEAAYAPYSAAAENRETPAYKALEAVTGRGLYPGEAYAPNVPSLVDLAAKAPAPEAAYLIKEANSMAPVPAVAKIIDTAQESGTHADCARLAAAEKAAYPIRNEPEAALSPSP